MGAGTSAIWTLEEDDPLIQDDDYEFDADDRGYIDSQVRGIQSHLLQSLLLGVHCTWRVLDSGSAPANVGDVLCSAGTGSQTVTRALPTPLASAGMPLGVVMLGAPGGGAVQPGKPVLMAMEGIVPASITGLTGGGSNVYARVSSSAVAQATASQALGDYPLGAVDAYGNLTLDIGPALASTGLNASGLFVSTVDIAAGAGLAGITNNSGNKTRAIPFGATQAGRYCTGARFYWAGPATTLTITLWDSVTNAPVATVNVNVTSTPGIFTATFATPYALQPGRSMAISSWDTAGAGGHYTTYNGQTSGTAPMGAFLPYSGLSNLIGPFVEVCGFGGAASSASALWGLTSAGNAVPTTAGTDTTGWNPIEPMVA